MTICLSATRSSGPCVLTVYPRSARQPLQLRKRFGPFSGLRSPALLPMSFAILALRVSAIYSVPCLLQAHCIPIAALIPQAMFPHLVVHEPDVGARNSESKSVLVCCRPEFPCHSPRIRPCTCGPCSVLPASNDYCNIEQTTDRSQTRLDSLDTSFPL